jgi:hypothetical protein
MGGPVLARKAGVPSSALVTGGNGSIAHGGNAAAGGGGGGIFGVIRPLVERNSTGIVSSGGVGHGHGHISGSAHSGSGLVKLPQVPEKMRSSAAPSERER